MDSTWIYKTAAVCICLFTLACSDLDRDNLLDPKNPSSRTSQRVVIEAFVNLNSNKEIDDPPPYNQYMIEALDSLNALYPDILIAEYHRNAGLQGEYTDQYHREENDVHYQLYLDAIDSDSKGVPDVFINGADRRVRGASSVQTAFSRLQEVLNSQLSLNSQLRIEILMTKDENRLSPKIKIARLGSTAIDNLLVRGVLITDLNTNFLHHVVQKSVKSSIIPRLDGSETITISLPEITINLNQKNSFIAMITNSNEDHIYQSESFVIPETENTR